MVVREASIDLTRRVRLYYPQPNAATSARSLLGLTDHYDSFMG